MESEDEEKDSKTAPAPTTEGEEPWETIDTPEGPPDLPCIPETRQSNTSHALARFTHSLL